MKTAGTTSVNLTATSPLDRPADHATCPHCGSAISRIVRKSGTVVWKCGTWHSPNLKITEQSRHCRVNELEKENKGLKGALRGIYQMATEAIRDDPPDGSLMWQIEADARAVLEAAGGEA